MVIIFLVAPSLFIVVIIWSPAQFTASGNGKPPSAVIKIRQTTIVQRWNFSPFRLLEVKSGENQSPPPPHARLQVAGVLLAAHFRH